ncbi:MAG: protein kinase [Polyangiaceae bacterium]
MAESREGPFRVGDSVEGRYRIDGVLGSGGMGVVYAAEHLFTGAPVAMKALYNLAGDYRERMRLEARALADIRHPNVVPVTDGGVTDAGVVWFAMPRLEGQTLRSEIWRKRGLGVERALRFGIQIAEGLAAAHDKGLVHRDLKPENVFVVDQDDSIRVLDFGTSKFQRGQLKTTDRFRIIGTHAYMSPERIQADLVDHRADIYALGHILYEMLSGMHALSEGPGPLDLPPIHELGIRQIYAPPPPLSERAPYVPGAVAQIVYRALAKNRKERHESMRELAAELRRELEKLGAQSKTSAATTPEPTALPRPAGVMDRNVQPIATVDEAPRELSTEPMDPNAVLTTEPTAVAEAAPSVERQKRLLELDLIEGAAGFACSSDRPSETHRALVALSAASRVDESLASVLRATLLGAAALDEPRRAAARRLLLDWQGGNDVARDRAAERLGQIAKVSGRHRTALSEPERLVSLATGACVMVEPASRLDAAETALFALDRTQDDVRSFALSVLIAFGRASESERAHARGALLALILGGSEDTELARAELGRLMLDMASLGDTLESVHQEAPVAAVAPRNVQSASAAGIPAVSLHASTHGPRGTVRILEGAPSPPAPDAEAPTVAPAPAVAAHALETRTAESPNVTGETPNSMVTPRAASAPRAHLGLVAAIAILGFAVVFVAMRLLTDDSTDTEPNVRASGSEGVAPGATMIPTATASSNASPTPTPVAAKAAQPSVPGASPTSGPQVGRVTTAAPPMASSSKLSAQPAPQPTEEPRGPIFDTEPAKPNPKPQSKPTSGLPGSGL